jgi:thiosulfate/3-mercaptopyruvate sulfurtransferase
MRMRNAVLAVLVCCSLTVLFARPGMALWGTSEVETEKIAVTFANEVVRGGYQSVTTEGLKKMMDEKKDLLIIDTMPFEASYKKNHIPGAVHFEFPIPEMASMDDAMKAKFEKVLGQNKDRVIVFYCGFTTCTRSHNGAMWAVKLGYKNIYRQPGGIKAWIEAKYPVEESK